jgi:hypothetical protein
MKICRRIHKNKAETFYMSATLYFLLTKTNTVMNIWKPPDHQKEKD